MEFDAVQDKKNMSNFKYWKSEFAKHNYELPKIIFWNVARNVGSFPVTKLDYGTCLVSGYSKNILKSIIDIENFDPIDVMFLYKCIERISILADQAQRIGSRIELMLAKA